MAATYNKNNFIQPVGENTSLKIRDCKSVIRHTLYYNTATNFYVEKNNIVIKTDSDNNLIRLDFASNIEALQALVKLKQNYSLVRENTNKNRNSGNGEVDIKTIIFSDEPDSDDNIQDQQTIFNIPTDAAEIQTVSINGVVINDYSFDQENSRVVLITNLIGYEIEFDDEVMIKYFAQ